MKQLLDPFPSSSTDELNIKAHELHDMRFIDLNLYHFGWEKPIQANPTGHMPVHIICSTILSKEKAS